MKILYTGAPTFLTPQNDPNQSLGGFVSSSIIPNDVNGNLFGEVSYLGLTNQYRETKATVLFNDGTSINNLLLGIFPKIIPSNYRIKVAVVKLTANQMERIPNMRSLPLSATFHERYMLTATDVGNMFSLGKMPTGTYFGVWTERLLDGLTIPDGVTPCQYYGTANGQPKFDGYDVMMLAQ